MSSLLEGRVAIVTGSGQGIGRAIALRFAQEGASVVVNNRSPHTSHRTAEQTARDIESLGGKAAVVYGDVARMEVAQQLARTALEQFGHIDILVNNAGVSRDLFLWDMSETDWDEVVNASLKGAFACSRYAVPVMMQQGNGCVIHLSSLAGIEGRPKGVNYVAAKAGLIGLSRAMDKELWPKGIRVNCVCPMASTSMSVPEHARAPEGYSMPHYRALRRAVRPPEAIAAVIAFLVSDLANDVHGQVLWAQAGSIGAYDEPRPSRILHAPTDVWDAQALAETWAWAMREI